MPNLSSIPLDQRLPAFGDPLAKGVVVAETEAFADGDGARATLTADALVIEVRTDDATGHLVIPVTTLLDAIQTANRTHES